MSKDSSENSDELIRKKNFGRATGIDLSAFNLNQDVIENTEPARKQEIQEPEMDQAVGEVYEFSQKVNRLLKKMLNNSIA